MLELRLESVTDHRLAEAAVERCKRVGLVDRVESSGVLVVQFLDRRRIQRRLEEVDRGHHRLGLFLYPFEAYDDGAC